MPEEVMVTIVMVTFILTTGSVLILRPTLNHIVQLIKTIIEERRTRRTDLLKTQELLLNIDRRLELLEEQQHFKEIPLSASPNHSLNHSTQNGSHLS
jgi:hypothetical protein